MVVLSFVFSPVASYAQVWTPPSSTPPNGNPSVPIHVGSTPQSKSGPFLANTGVYSLSRVVAPKICTTKVGGMPPIVEISQSFVAMTAEELASSEALYLDCIESWLDVLPDGNNNGDTLIWNETTQTWEVGQGGAGLPPGNLFGDVLMWDTHTSSWIVVPDIDYLFTDHTDGVTDFYSSATSDWQTTEGLRYIDTPDYAELPYNPPDNEYATDRVLIGYPGGTEDNQGQLHPIGEFKSLTWDLTDLTSVNVLSLRGLTELRIDAGSEGGQTGLPGQVLSVIGGNGKAGWVDVGSLLASEAIIPETCTVGQTIEFNGTDWICGEGGGYNTDLSFDNTTNTLSVTDDGGTLTTTVDAMPDGTIPGQSIFWNHTIQDWIPNQHFRNEDVAPGTFVMGNWPDVMYDELALSPNPDPVVGQIPSKLALYGRLFFKSGSQGPGAFDTTGKILGNVNNTNYEVGWVDPAEFLGIPDGTITGNVLAWNEVAEEWQLSGGVFAFPDSTGMINFGDYYWQEDSCGNGNMLYTQEVEQGNLDGSFSFNCTNALSVINTADGNAIRLSYLEQVPEAEYPGAGVRHLCYASNQHTWGVFPNFFSVDQGQVIDCEAGSNGQMVINGPVGETTLGNNGTQTWPYSTPSEDYEVFNWNDIPFGVDQIVITACAGGGGGGGGSSGDPLLDEGSPSSTDQAGGGGGGGGEAGECVSDQVIDLEEGITGVRFTVGRGGNGGAGGSRSCDQSDPADPFCNGTGGTGNGSSGQAGFITKVEQMNGNTVVATSLSLSGGSGGFGAYFQCQATGAFACNNVGGIGGRGGLVPLISDNLQYNAAQYYLPYNGQIGRDAEFNTEDWGTIFNAVEYAMNQCGANNDGNGLMGTDYMSCGGNGGLGEGAELTHPNLASPYQYLSPPESQMGDGGNGGSGCDPDDCLTFFNGTGGGQGNYAGDESGSDGKAGDWASGGGAGGGANGWMWADYNGGANGVEYYSKGSDGGRGGPGFVSVEW